MLNFIKRIDFNKLDTVNRQNCHNIYLTWVLLLEDNPSASHQTGKLGRHSCKRRPMGSFQK